MKKLPTKRGDYFLTHYDLWKQRAALLPPSGAMKSGANILCIGSCFCRDAARYLRRRDYQAEIYPAGHLYNAEVIRIELDHVLEGTPWPVDVALSADGYFAHRIRKRITGKTRQELISLDREITERATKALHKADVILTLMGTTTEVWRESEDGPPTNEIPPVISHQSGRWLVTPGRLEDLRSDIAAIQKTLEEHTRATLAYAVCPIPLYATWLDCGIIEANGRSKALLRVALEMERTDSALYLPLWDWMQAQTGHWSPTKRDGRHFSSVGIDRVMLMVEQSLSAKEVPDLSVSHRLWSRSADLLERLRNQG